NRNLSSAHQGKARIAQRGRAQRESCPLDAAFNAPKPAIKEAGENRGAVLIPMSSALLPFGLCHDVVADFCISRSGKRTARMFCRRSAQYDRMAAEGLGELDKSGIA